MVETKIEEVQRDKLAVNPGLNNDQEEVEKDYVAILLYNMGCCYQRLGVLDDSVNYLEAAILNIDQKLEKIEVNLNKSYMIIEDEEDDTEDRLAPDSILANKLHKMRYQCKIHL